MTQKIVGVEKLKSGGIYRVKKTRDSITFRQVNAKDIRVHNKPKRYPDEDSFW